MVNQKSELSRVSPLMNDAFSLRKQIADIERSLAETLEDADTFDALLAQSETQIRLATARLRARIASCTVPEMKEGSNAGHTSEYTPRQVAALRSR